MKEEESEAGFEVDEASGVSVPTTIVLLPCTIHSKLVSDAQGPGETGEREEMEGEVEVELLSP